MKKIIAFVLVLAMVLSVCAFSASAATAPSVVLEGAATAVAGETYTVSVRLNGADDVAGVQGEIAYANATVKEIVVNPQLRTWNNTEDDNTIVYNDGNSVNFATLADVTGTRLLVKITFTVAEGATFSLANVKFADDNAAVLEGTTGAALAPTVISAEAAKSVSIVGVGMRPEETATKQAVVVRGKVDADDVKEIGVLFYPTQLLNGKALTLETAGAVKAVATENLENILAVEEGFDGILNVDFEDELKAAKFLGVKVTSVVYYKDSEGNVTYSSNTVDKYIKNGVASKAILNTALDKVKGVESNELDAALADLDNVATMVANRNIVLKYAVQAAAQ